MPEDPILEVKDLSIAFDKTQALLHVSFSVEKGDALMIIGPNGAGKTILFRALLGLVPYEGIIRWKEGIRIGYVPQKFVIDKGVPVSVKEFFLLKSQKFWFPEKDFLLHLGHELKLVGLSEDVFSKTMGELSGGEFQRVLIAWAMIDHPDVLLFDEPTAGIDVGFEETAYTLLHRVQDERGTTVLMISHDLNMVYRYAKKVLCINKKLVCQGAPEEVLSPEELSKLYGGGRFYHHLETK